MRVAFLDIDGVLNSRAFYDRVGLIPHPWLDPEAVLRFDQLCREADASVVISSAWRGDERTPEWLVERGLTSLVIGCTGWAGPTGNRGSDIEVWLEEHQRLVNCSSGRIDGPNAIERFCILDDGDDKDHLLPDLVQTDHATGLLNELVERAITLLKGQP